MRLNKKKKLALVLSGGGVKAAAFHIGVCQALGDRGYSFLSGNKSENPEPFDSSKTFQIYVGSSAGALISTILASGFSVEALVHAFEVGAGRKKFSTFSGRGRLKPIRYMDLFDINSKNIGFSFARFFPSLLKQRLVSSGGIENFIKNSVKLNGFFTTKGLEKYLRGHVLIENDFSKLNAELFITATQLNHSRKIVFGDFPSSIKQKEIQYANFASISDAVAASVALPPFYAPYGIKNEKGKEIHYFDGGIRDTLSSHVAEERGADLIIASFSVQPYHFTEEVGSLHNFGIPMIINQALYQVIQQKITGGRKNAEIIKGIYNSLNTYLKQEKIEPRVREHILEIVKQKSGYNPNIDHLYIHPSPNDYEMFFADHFSLGKDVLKRIVNIGYKSAIATLDHVESSES